MFFHALTFAESRRSCVKHLPMDQASVNAMKQTCVIIILSYFTLFQQNHTENAAKILKYQFLHCISLNKMALAV